MLVVRLQNEITSVVLFLLNLQDIEALIKKGEGTFFHSEILWDFVCSFCTALSNLG